MYRLLIVDDEPIIVDGLYELLKEHSELELDICRSYSSVDALNYMKMTRVDILLTDINMPELNGLELMEKARLLWPSCKVIFLSCHNEFDYIYKAIKTADVRYVLKNESDDTVICNLKEAIEEIDTGLKMDELLIEASHKMELALPLLQKEFILDFLSNEEAIDLLMLQKHLDDLRIPLNVHEPFVLLLGRIDNLPRKIFASEKSKLLHAANELLSHELSLNRAPFYVSIDSNKILWFIHLKDINSTATVKNRSTEPCYSELLSFLKGTLEKIQDIYLNKIGYSLSFVLNETPVFCKDIYSQYNFLYSLLTYHIGLESGIVLVQKSKANGENKTTNTDKIQLSQTRMLRNVEQYLLNGELDSLSQEILSILKLSNPLHSEHLLVDLESFYSLSVLFLSYINRCNLIERLSEKINIDRLTHIEKHTSYKDMVEYFVDLGKTIIEAQQDNQVTRNVEYVIKSKHYIEKHLSEDISQIQVAETVGLNPSYLSRVFKQVTGDSLSEYILGRRLEKAKELLNDENVKVYEVGTMVGFNSSSYFIKAFKSHTNMTPQRYKEIALKSKINYHSN